MGFKLRERIRISRDRLHHSSHKFVYFWSQWLEKPCLYTALLTTGQKNASTLIKSMIGATDGGGQKEPCIFFYIHLFSTVLILSSWRACETWSSVAEIGKCHWNTNKLRLLSSSMLKVHKHEIFLNFFFT